MLPVFVNKVLLGDRHTPLCACVVHGLFQHVAMAESVQPAESKRTCSPALGRDHLLTPDPRHLGGTVLRCGFCKQSLLVPAE